MTDSPSSRVAFRRWAREHHPDVGGDADTFAAGVAALREGRFERFAAQQAQVQRPRSPLRGDDRYAEPYVADPGPLEPENRVEVYVQRSARGVVKLYGAARRWNTKRKLPPRVR